MYELDFKLPGGVQLDLAKLSDASEIAQMSRDLIEVGLGWTWRADRVKRYIRHPQAMVAVARKGADMLGFGILQFSQDQAHINLLAVRKDYQHAGIGTELVSFLERCAALSGVSFVLLEVRLKNYQARSFYQSLGYQEVSRLHHYYRGREDAVRMVHAIGSQIELHIAAHKLN